VYDFTPTIDTISIDQNPLCPTQYQSGPLYWHIHTKLMIAIFKQAKWCNDASYISCQPQSVITEECNMVLNQFQQLTNNCIHHQMLKITWL